MSIFSKIGGFVKKFSPIAGLIPGVGTIASGALNMIGSGLEGGGGGDTIGSHGNLLSVLGKIAPYAVGGGLGLASIIGNAKDRSKQQKFINEQYNTIKGQQKANAPLRQLGRKLATSGAKDFRSGDIFGGFMRRKGGQA